MTAHRSVAVRSATAVLAIFGLAACDDGRVSLSVADAPVDEARAVVVQFSEVSFVRDDGERESVRLSPPLQVDLLEQTGGASFELVSSQTLSSGGYRAVEFEIDGSETTIESYVELANGGRSPLFVPDDARSGLRVNAGFDIDDGDHLKLTADFDLRRSVHAGSNDTYELRPVLRLVVDEQTGVVEGAVAQGLLPSGCVPAVYAFGGRDATPDDVDGIDPEPLTSAIVATAAAAPRYAIGFLNEGNYTLALTCDAGDDDPGQSDTVAFVRTRNVEVRAGRTTTLDFD